jgi:hypothetical protein
MALIDAVVRQLPGVLNDAESAQQDSFVAGLLDCPHYTRPEEYDGRRVPDVLVVRSPRGNTTLAPATGAGSNVAAASRVVGGAFIVENGNATPGAVSGAMRSGQECVVRIHGV